MKIKAANILLIFLIVLQVPAVDLLGRVVVSGYVRDAASGEELIGANVAIMETGSGSITNSYGYYSISLTPGFYTLVCSYVGYETQQVPVQLGKDMQLNIELLELSLELEEVTVSAEAGNANITRVETGSTQLSIQVIEKKRVIPYGRIFCKSQKNIRIGSSARHKERYFLSDRALQSQPAGDGSNAPCGFKLIFVPILHPDIQ